MRNGEDFAALVLDIVECAASERCSSAEQAALLDRLRIEMDEYVQKQVRKTIKRMRETGEML